jgi:hypothetical protein
MFTYQFISIVLNWKVISTILSVYCNNYTILYYTIEFGSLRKALDEKPDLFAITVRIWINNAQIIIINVLIIIINVLMEIMHAWRLNIFEIIVW